MRRTTFAIATAITCWFLPGQPGDAAGIVTNDFGAKKTIVTDTLRNGGFETGSGVNWLVSGPTSGTTVTLTPKQTSPPGPSEGSWFAEATVSGGSGNRIARLFHRNRNLGLTLDDGNILRISAVFARPETLGLTTIQILPQLMSNNTVVATLSQRQHSTASADPFEWVAITNDWLIPGGLGFDGVDVRIDMRAGARSSSATFTGFLDNLVIQQGVVVPEPSTALIAPAWVSRPAAERKWKIHSTAKLGTTADMLQRARGIVRRDRK